MYPTILQSWMITIFSGLLVFLVIAPIFGILLSVSMGKSDSYPLYKSFLILIMTLLWQFISIIWGTRTYARDQGILFIQAIKEIFRFTVPNRKSLKFLFIVIPWSILLHCSSIVLTSYFLDKLASLDIRFTTRITNVDVIANSVLIYYFIIFAPIIEETLDRGLWLKGFLSYYSPFKSVINSSFIFALAHLSISHLLVGVIMGIFFGWVYYRTGSLLICIICHICTNVFLLRVIPNMETSFSTLFYSNDNIPIFPFWLYILSIAIIAISLFTFYRTINKSAKEIAIIT